MPPSASDSQQNGTQPPEIDIWQLLDGLWSDLDPDDPDSQLLSQSCPEKLASSGLQRVAEFVGAELGSLYVGNVHSGYRLLENHGPRELPQQLPGRDESADDESAGNRSSDSTTAGAETPALFMECATTDQRPLFIRDASRFRAEHGLPAPAFVGEHLGPGCIVLPLVSHRKVWGVINLAALGNGPPEPRRRRVVVHAAQVLATSIRVSGLLHRLQGQATCDGLTGLLNYAAFYDVLAREVLRAERYQTPLSLILFDLDHFKSINDRYGHLAGDHILAEMARRTRAALRAPDLAARYGGDEFAVILPQTDHTGAGKVASRIRDNILAAPCEYLQTPIRVAISAGVAELRSGMTAVDLVSSTDGFLYQAKHGGRDRIAGG